MAVTDLVFIPMVNITPHRIVNYQEVQGLTRKGGRRASLPKLENVSPSGITPLHVINPDAGVQLKRFLQSLNEDIEADNLQKIKLANLKAEKYNGTISWAAKKRITTAINWMYALTELKKVNEPDLKIKQFRISMITLTLCAAQSHDDAYIKKQLLEPFLRTLRETHNMKSYVWRAEAQENGNIHFHITTNIFLHHLKIRAYWNKIQAKHGYIDSFEAIHGHRDPNGTDVHSVYQIRNLAAYLAKYMSKNPDPEKERVIDGRQWYLSSNLSKIKPINKQFSGDLRRNIEDYVTNNKKKFKIHDYATVFYADIFSANLKKYPELALIKKEALLEYSLKVN